MQVFHSPNFGNVCYSSYVFYVLIAKIMEARGLLDTPRSRTVIQALGGTVAVARLFGIRHPAVARWKRCGIPENRLRVLQLLYKDLPAVAATLDFKPWEGRT